MKHNKKEGLIIDLFAGGGGASVGIEMALGRPVDIAVNHDPKAILMHKTNHPDTLHLIEDIFEVDLQKYVKGRKVDLLWASPDCRHFSKAKGTKPKDSGIRFLPWAVYKHTKALNPEVIIMENVEEIQDWGPLDEKGYPIKEKKGEDYNKFISAMQELGYQFDCRELVAADYGAPTIRKRWYAVFRRDGKSIIWPEPTHNKYGTNGMKKWVPIYQYLDFTNLGTSIFGRKKPLADNTMARIANGSKKFVFDNPTPFIINSKTDQIIKTPFIDKAYGGNYNGYGSDINNPLSTVTTVDHNRLVTPVIGKINADSQPGFKVPYIIQYHSETQSGEVRGQTVKEPLKTIDTSNRYALIMAFLTKFYKTETGQSMFEPIHTITTSAGHFGQVSIVAVKLEEILKSEVSIEVAQKCTWVSEFIIKYYGRGTEYTVKEPLHTVTTKDRFALITILGNEYVLLDIFLRMLTPEELKLGQGFPKDYIIDRDYKWNVYPVSERVKRIGNSVVPIMAQTLVNANCGYLKVGEREPLMNIDYSQNQLCFI